MFSKLEITHRFVPNTPGDIYEMPSCTDYCAECGRHKEDH